MTLPRIRGFLTLSEYLKLYEGGNAVEARPMSQTETKEVYDYVQKNVFPKLGLSGEGIDAAVIGSFGKKNPDQTSGDIDVAVSADVIAAKNDLTFEQVLDFVYNTMKSEGYETAIARGFNQVSISVNIPGTKDFGQVDLMLSTNLDWSRFIYHSPDFTKAESKYKGAYRNILLMGIISESKREVEKTTDKGETEEYSQYAVRMESGVYKVQKSFLGKKGGLVKTAKLLHEYDKFITNTPEVVVELAFGKGVVPADVMTFESAWSKFMSNDFPYKEKRDAIVKRFYAGIRGRFPIPEEAEKAFPNIFN